MPSTGEIGWVGRARELEQLERALGDAAEGRPRVVLVLGPTGIGKSALLQTFADRADIPLRVGTCLPFGGGDVPFLPFIELLRGMVRASSPDELLPILGPARGEVARLLPELGPITRREEDPGVARALLFEQIRGVAERLGERETRIIAIEDLQWADGSTRDLVLFLARNVRASRLLLLLTCRTDDLHPGHPFAGFAAELERARNVERLELDGLDHDQVAEQAAVLLGAPPPRAFVTRLMERTGGNPLFVEELVAAAVRHDLDPDTPMPPRLHDALTARLMALSPATRRLVGLTAVAGHHTDPAVLAHVSATRPEEEAVAGALREAIDAGILVAEPQPADGARIRFRHPIMREVAEADLLPGDRARAHARLAAWLETLGDGPEIVAQIANHWAAAGETDRALGASLAAGRAAGSANAPGEALRHLERALRIFDGSPATAARAGISRSEILERLADAATRAGAHDRAVSATRDALDAIDPAAEPERVADLRRSLRWSLWSAGDAAGALAEAVAAVALLEHAGPSPARANALAHVAGLRLMMGDAELAAAVATRALDEAAATNATSEETLAVGVLGLAKLRLGEPEAGLAHVREAWQRALQAGHVTGIALAHEQLAGALAGLGRTREAADLASQGIATADRLGLERTFGVLLRASAAESLLSLGRWSDARRCIDEGLAGEPTGNEGVAIHLAACRLATGSGDASAAERHLAEAQRLAEARSTGAPGWSGTLAAAELAFAQGRADAAREVALTGLGGNVPEWHRPALLLLSLRALADIALAARVHGDPSGVSAARSEGAALLRLARTDRPGVPPEVIAAFRLAAQAEAGRIGSSVSPERWEAVTRAWLTAERPVAAAVAALRAAEAWLARGGSAGRAGSSEREAAARAVVQGIELAGAIGAQPLVDELHDLARRARLDMPAARGHDAPAGEPVPLPATPGGSPAAGLTARELEVLELVVQGRTNREIGAALFISPKTVSVHVTSILGKLGVPGRVEAATTAIRLGLVRFP